ncbi:MAG: energy-coupling factor ABC transporter permease, partial [Chloroflexi bacterium]|nr:energy-coupling factor ABC transporter permease [Chloroflexota bacterium]
AAFIFAAQSINVPVGGGTSGHLLGGVLAAIILGPWSAVLIMASVVGVQAILFQDGGITALGFNIINMGVITAFTGHFIYQQLKKILGEGRNSMLIAGAVGGWLSMMIGAVAAGIELAISGTSPLNVAVPAMAIVHAVLGIIEAVITVGALTFIYSTRRDLLAIGESAPAHTSAAWVGVGLALALVVAAFSPLASPTPDGLEKVAAQYNFLGKATSPLYNRLPNYTIPFITNEIVGGIVAVVLGTLIVFSVVFLIGRAQKRANA